MIEERPEPRDTGPNELGKRHRIIPRTKGASGYAYDLYVVDGCAPDKMLLSGSIDVNEHSALMSWMVMLHRAHMIGPKGPSYEKHSASDPAYISGKTAVAMAKVSKVIENLDRKIGRAARSAVVDLCLIDKMPSPSSPVKVWLEGLRSAMDEVS